MSRQFVGLLYVYRKFAPEQASTLQLNEVDHLSKALNGTWSTKFALSSALVKSIRTHHLADISWMEQRLGDSLEEIGKTDGPLVVNSEADLINTAPETVKQIRALVGRQLSRQYRSNTPEHIAQLFHGLRSCDFTLAKTTPWERLQSLFRL